MEPSSGHDYVDELIGCLRVARMQRDDAEERCQRAQCELNQANNRLVNLANKVWDTRWITDDTEYQSLIGVAAEIRSGNLKSV